MSTPFGICLQCVVAGIRWWALSNFVESCTNKRTKALRKAMFWVLRFMNYIPLINTGTACIPPWNCKCNLRVSTVPTTCSMIKTRQRLPKRSIPNIFRRSNLPRMLNKGVTGLRLKFTLWQADLTSWLQRSGFSDAKGSKHMGCFIMGMSEAVQPWVQLHQLFLSFVVRRAVALTGSTVPVLYTESISSRISFSVFRF